MELIIYECLHSAFSLMNLSVFETVVIEVAIADFILQEKMVGLNSKQTADFKGVAYIKMIELGPPLGLFPVVPYQNFGLRVRSPFGLQPMLPCLNNLLQVDFYEYLQGCQIAIRDNVEQGKPEKMGSLIVNILKKRYFLN
ncbi:MAG: hypothetical protein EZS28_041554 [Streblomastix strix]|uniref:Uncharacterized protein n=1 Tax=Streblomastix strix TaxID=222440 RepID=A0A5J4TYD9_9EUKA|nr:MAG: hypothetical protein EZS28_041554 [Streblomastix strix]